MTTQSPEEAYKKTESLLKHVADLNEQLKENHTIDLKVRRDGQDFYYEADWLMELLSLPDLLDAAHAKGYGEAYKKYSGYNRWNEKQS